MKYFLIGLILLSNSLMAQEGVDESANKTKRFVCLTTVNQMQRCGYLLSDNGRELELETAGIGILIIQKSDVIEILDAEEGTQSVNLNSMSSRASRNIVASDRAPQSSRYFFAPSALPMEKKEGYAHANWLSANVSSQVSDNLMVGAALSWVGLGVQLKASAQLSENLHGSIGGMALYGFADIGPTFFPYINVTSGDHNNHFSMAFAALAIDGEVSPMVNLSFCKELNPTLWLISENYYFTDPILFSEKLLLSFGARWWNARKNRLDELAIMLMIAEDGEAIPIPWFGRTWPF
jgi:hypothetical protein